VFSLKYVMNLKKKDFYNLGSVPCEVRAETEETFELRASRKIDSKRRVSRFKSYRL
jgi:hypothetical protein